MVRQGSLFAVACEVSRQRGVGHESGLRYRFRGGQFPGQADVAPAGQSVAAKMSDGHQNHHLRRRRRRRGKRKKEEGTRYIRKDRVKQRMAVCPSPNCRLWPTFPCSDGRDD